MKRNTTHIPRCLVLGISASTLSVATASEPSPRPIPIAELKQATETRGPKSNATGSAQSVRQAAQTPPRIRQPEPSRSSPSPPASRTETIAPYGRPDLDERYATLIERLRRIATPKPAP